MSDNVKAHQFHAMGCPCEIRTAINTSQHLIDECIAEVRRFESKYSRYQDDSLITEINLSAGITPVPIDDETNALFDYATTCFDLSDGLFDITSGVLRSIWHSERVSLPSGAELAEVLPLIGWDKVDRSNGDILLPFAGMELDLGGVVKEYVADALVARLSAADVQHAMINLGGDIALLGPQPDGEPWLIGIADPEHPDTAMATIAMDAGAITTSGGYERYFDIAGERYSHLLNPKTGMPVDNLTAVTIIAPQAVVAGSLSTIALLKPQLEATEWLQDCGAAYLATDRTGVTKGSLLQE